MIQAYSIPETCKIAGQGRTGIYEAINSGKLVAHKRGKRTIIFSSDLEQYLEALPQIAVKQPIERAVSGTASLNGADNCAGEVSSTAKPGADEAQATVYRHGNNFGLMEQTPRKLKASLGGK